MLKLTMKSIALGGLALVSFGTVAQALPLGGKLTTPAPSNVEQVYWKRVCDRDGDRCRSIWINPGFRHDYDRYDWRFRRDHDRREFRHNYWR